MRLALAGAIASGSFAVRRRYQPSALDNIEELENYRPGGLGPVHVGDVFANGWYRVLHKLGYGGFATVWLGRDAHQEQHVALMILTAENSVDDGDGIGSAKK